MRCLISGYKLNVMMAWDWVLIFIAIITAIVVWLRWNFNHWKNRGIPYVEPTLLFGNVKELIIGNRSLAIVCERIYDAFPNEPWTGYFQLRDPVIMIKDLDLVKAVCVSEFNSFRNNGKSISREADPIFGRNPFFLKDNEWRETRKIQTHGHTASKLKILFGYVEEVKDELINHLNQNLDKKYDVQEFCARFTTDIVSSCVFGIKTRSISNEESEFRRRSEHILDMNWRMLLWRVAPYILEWFKISLLLKTNQDYFYDLVKSVVEMRKTGNLRRADFIQNLIDEKTEDSTLMDITAQTITFFIDGYATSATEMSFFLYMLAIHPDVQERLREEVNNEEKLDFDTIHRLPYMDAVFNESLRLYPAAVQLNRVCNQDTTITINGKAYEFKNGDTIDIPVYSIHRDPKYFVDPLKFDPDRFMNDPNNLSNLLTFGIGPRACFGSRFAKTQLKSGIAGLVKNFKILPGTSDWSMPSCRNNSSILISPDSEMIVKFEKL